MFPIRNKQHYETSIIHPLLARYGGACYPLDDAVITSGAQAGVARELSGLYPGAISGTTYYNQVTVSGTLNPNIAGTWTVGGLLNGKPYYTNGVANWWLGDSSGSNAWRIRNSSPVGANANDNWNATALIGNWFPGGGVYTGTATVANVTASGIYLFVPSGVTLQSAGPTLAGTSCKAAAFDGAAGKITVGDHLDVTGSFTLMCWAKWTTASNIVFMGKSHTNNYYMNTSNGRIIIWSKGKYAISKVIELDAGANLHAANNGNWNCIVGVIDATNPTDCIPSVYVNGVKNLAWYSIDANIPAPIADASSLCVSGAGSVAGVFNGSLAYATIITAALSAAEIYMLAKAQP
jgi:hypothetical protein